MGFHVGDEVWVFNKGFGVITSIENSNNHTYPIRVRLDYGETFHFTMDGKLHSGNELPSLFFGIPEINDASRPIRLVKRKEKGFLNVYKDTTTFFKTETEANIHDTGRVAMIPVEYEYEVDEDVEFF